MKVLVIERAGVPLQALVVVEDLCPSELHKRDDETVVRYVPESAQPAERAGQWVSVELAPLLGVLAYLSAEIGQYHKGHHAPSRIRRAKELLEKMLPPPPQPKEKP